MMAVMVLFWGAFIVGIVWLIRSVAGGGPSPSGETPVSRETAVQILERRFAEGALTLEDYTGITIFRSSCPRSLVARPA
jgi:uncharacterized membrane protein